jgi:Holliday junction DNA helicase RuvA
MFNYIKGKVTLINANYIVLENNNIGFTVKTPNPYSFTLNEETTIYTYLHVREDILDIYGFRTLEEKELFLQLISVKGIGPKGALAIVAYGDLSRLKQAIVEADVKYLQKFPGVGTKASSQIILDLQGKLTTASQAMEDPKISNVKEALRSLGYNNSELKKLDSFLSQNLSLPLEELVKQCLKKLF